MAEKVKLSKDGNSIDFVQTDNIPTSMKKFRQSPEIEGFYRFIYENDLQKEAYEILERIVGQRKIAKKALKQEAAQTKKMEQAQVKEKATALAAATPKPAVSKTTTTTKAATAQPAPHKKAAKAAGPKATPKSKPAKAAKRAPTKKAKKK